MLTGFFQLNDRLLPIIVKYRFFHFPNGKMDFFLSTGIPEHFLYTRIIPDLTPGGAPFGAIQRNFIL